MIRKTEIYRKLICAITNLRNSEFLTAQSKPSGLAAPDGLRRAASTGSYLGTDSKLILDAAYEATLLTAVINASRTGVNVVYLTLLGGGVFGNEDAWILAAIERAFLETKSHGLDVRIVLYRQSKPTVAELCYRIE